ncbi:TolC family protein [Chitinophaga flava]|nr:TolC family protein [Chitinophaga flava]
MNTSFLFNRWLNWAFIPLFFSCWLTTDVTAQTIPLDSTHLKLEEAEQIFLKNNLQLLAQQYNVDAASALIIQARLFPNPNFSVSQGFYNGENHKLFNFGNSASETQAALSQLIMLAGKRNKQIKLAKAGAQLAKYQLFDLIRTLKYTLRTNFFNIYYLQRSVRVYAMEIASLKVVVDAFEQQKGKGYISEKEVVRVKALLYSLQSEHHDLVDQINDLESELKLILQVKNTVYIVPDIDQYQINNLSPAKYPLATLIDSAYHARTDLLIAKTTTEINKLNYSYQKALAVPDLTLQAAYDRQGSYVHNFNSLGVAFDLPVFNRNQGNIKSAKASIKAADATQKSVEADIEGTVYRALQKALDADKLYKGIDPAFESDFERLQHEVLINYQKRNIGLLDFLDFYDSYKQNVLQTNNIFFNRVSAFEDINFYTGAEFFY